MLKTAVGKALIGAIALSSIATQASMVEGLRLGGSWAMSKRGFVGYLPEAVKSKNEADTAGDYLRGGMLEIGYDNPVFYINTLPIKFHLNIGTANALSKDNTATIVFSSEKADESEGATTSSSKSEQTTFHNPLAMGLLSGNIYQTARNNFSLGAGVYMASSATNGLFSVGKFESWGIVTELAYTRQLVNTFTFKASVKQMFALPNGTESLGMEHFQGNSRAIFTLGLNYTLV